ncbi:MAG: DUF4493 domain-containing protein [Bacteroidales bacterium]|nr:DUF4493 domain-containing protein [Bacteroidales bacterium]
MKKIRTYIALGLALAFGATSCTKNDLNSEEQGGFSLKVLFDPATRATPEELAQDCTINIYNTEGLIRTYEGIDAMPEKLWLVTGDYRCDILAGTPCAASFTEKTYKGSQPFTITAGTTTTVQVECRINNVMASVAFDQTILDQFSTYEAKVGGTLEDDQCLTFDASNDAIGYFTLAEDATALLWQFSGTHVKYGPFSKSGSIQDVEKGKKYSLTFTYTKGNPEGDLTFDIEVIKTTEEVEDNIIFEADPTGVAAVGKWDIWAKHATLYANVAESEFGSEGIAIRVRAAGTETWTAFPATKAGDNLFSTVATNLNPETTYEYQLVVNGEIIGSAKTFKTDYISLIPNAGMENWNNNEGWPMPYASGDAAWWGNGNKAADMAGLIISESDGSTYTEGSKSAKLSGKQIKILTIDKVAPGNLFSGYFVGTVGTSGGKVNVGRPFTARPSAMKVDYKYTCGTITHNEGGPANDNGSHNIGDPDRCHIYIALGDWDYKTYGGTAECPVQLNTTDPSTLFDPNTDAVIAYGELVRGEDVNDWTEAVIRLKYKDTHRRPTHIIISCTSSKLGDYLTGSYNSTLWVDNFELIYDEQVVTQ